MVQKTLDRSYPEPCCENGYAVRGDFCSGRSGSAQYPCCLDGAEYTCALEARGQGGRATPTTPPTTQPQASQLTEAARPTERMGPREVSAAGSSGFPREALDGESRGSRFSDGIINLTSDLVDGLWVARDVDNEDEDAQGGGDGELCVLFLTLDEWTGVITATPTTQQGGLHTAMEPTNDTTDTSEESNTSDSQRRCGVVSATGKQATGGSPAVAFALVTNRDEAEEDDTNEVLVRRGRVQLLTRTSTEDVGDAAARAALAILWEPASPDDGEEEGEGGAYREAWVKKDT